MKRRAFTLFSYLAAFSILAIMLEPAAEAKISDMLLTYRYTGSIRAAARSSVFSITPVPEPGRALLMLTGMMAMLMRRRR